MQPSAKDNVRVIIRRRSGAVIITERLGAPIWGFVIGLFVFPQLAVPLYTPSLWSRDAPQLVCYAVVLAAAMSWGCFRLIRMGVRFDDGGVTVRNFWRVYRLRWNEVSHFADGGNEKGAWALEVVRRDGRSHTAQGTLNSVKPEVLAVIGEIAGRHNVRMGIMGRSPAIGDAGSSADLPLQVREV